jgi:hypothetical protein
MDVGNEQKVLWFGQFRYHWENFNIRPRKTCKKNYSKVCSFEEEQKAATIRADIILFTLAGGCPL